MEEFRKKVINIQMLTTEDLSEAYSEMIKSHQTYLYKMITETIHNHLRGIRESEIESLIDRYLLTDIKYRGKQTISELDKGFQVAITETINENQNGDKDWLLKTYLEKIRLPLRRNQMDWLPEITDQFSKQLMKNLDLYIASFKGISDDNIHRTIDNIGREIAQLMKIYQNKFAQDYQNILKKFQEQNKKQISALINEFTLSNQKTSNIKMYAAIVELSNYELIEENGIFYAKNKNTEEKIELTFDGDMLSSKDNKIRYYVDNKKKRIGYFNDETKVTILVHNGLISLIPPKTETVEKSLILFKKETTKNGDQVAHNYQLYYNLELVTNPEKLTFMIEQLKEYTPAIYNKLVSDKDFEKILVQIKNSIDEQIQVDKTETQTELSKEIANQEEIPQSQRKPK